MLIDTCIILSMLANSTQDFTTEKYPQLMILNHVNSNIEFQIGNSAYHTSLITSPPQSQFTITTKPGNGRIWIWQQKYSTVYNTTNLSINSDTMAVLSLASPLTPAAPGDSQVVVFKYNTDGILTIQTDEYRQALIINGMIATNSERKITSGTTDSIIIRWGKITPANIPTSSFAFFTRSTTKNTHQISGKKQQKISKKFTYLNGKSTTNCGFNRYQRGASKFRSQYIVSRPIVVK